jgi:hypothetical protein
MPEYCRQRNEFYATNPNPRFVHYTRAEAALEIIKKKRLWLRNATAMVDFREVNHGFELLSKWFHSGDNRTRFSAAFDQIHCGAALEAIARFDAMWHGQISAYAAKHILLRFLCMIRPKTTTDACLCGAPLELMPPPASLSFLGCRR